MTCKACTDCGECLALECFYERKSRPGRLSVCRECMKGRWRKWNRAKRGDPNDTRRPYRPRPMFDMGPVNDPAPLVWTMGRAA